MLFSLNVFNGETMNQAIWQFKRYEDSSLEYTGINRHEDEENVGGWDTVIRKEEFEAMFSAQQKSVAAPKPERPTFVNQPVVPKPQPKPVTPTPAPKPVTPVRPVTPTGTPIRPTPQPIIPSYGRPNISIPSAVTHIDVSDIKEGMVVGSKTFGDGTVVSVYENRKYCKVKFAGGIKQFAMQDAFDKGFLKKK